MKALAPFMAPEEYLLLVLKDPRLEFAEASGWLYFLGVSAKSLIHDNYK